MYFAVNKHVSPDLLPQVVSCIQGSPANTRWFALVDKAFDHDRRAPLRWPHRIEPLYRGPEGVTMLSPTLFEIRSDASDNLQREIARLVQHCQGRPMLSFVQTTLGLNELADAWQDVKWLHTEDQQRFLLRLADTRVLSSLPDCLQSHNWAHVCAPLMAWHVVNRAGHLQPLKMPEPVEGRIEPAKPFQIDDKELALLLDAAQPDVLINTLFEQVPDMLPTGQDLAKAHEWVRGACDIAYQHGLASMDDQLALAASACLTGGAVLKHSSLVDVLNQHQFGHAILADALAELVSEDEVATA